MRKLSFKTKNTILTILASLVYCLTNAQINGTSTINSQIGLGGALNQNTSIDGGVNNQNFDLLLDRMRNIYLNANNILVWDTNQRMRLYGRDSIEIGSTGKINIFTSGVVQITGNIKLPTYLNDDVNNKVLTTDASGNLAFLNLSSLFTTANHSILNGGNSVSSSELVIGTNNDKPIIYKVNNDVYEIINSSRQRQLNLSSQTSTINGTYTINAQNQLNYISNTMLTTGGTALFEMKANEGKLRFEGIEGNMYFTSNINMRTSQLSFLPINDQTPTRFSYYGTNITSTSPLFTINGSYGGGTDIVNISNNGNIFLNKHLGSTLIGNSIEPFSCAKLEISSTAHGFLPPRMTTTQRSAIQHPTQGLLVYNTNEHTIEVYTNSGGWKKLVTESESSSRSTVTSTSSIETKKSFVVSVGDGKSFVYEFEHNLNAEFVMVQFVDCGPEANCNSIINIPAGVSVETSNKNKVVVRFKEVPSFRRYKLMILKMD